MMQLIKLVTVLFLASLFASSLNAQSPQEQAPNEAPETPPFSGIAETVPPSAEQTPPLDTQSEGVELKADVDENAGSPWLGSFGGMAAGACVPALMVGAGGLIVLNGLNTDLDDTDAGEFLAAFFAIGGGALLLAIGAPSLALCGSGGACVGGGLFGGEKVTFRELAYGAGVGAGALGLGALTSLGGLAAAFAVTTQVGPIVQYTGIATMVLFVLAGPATAATIAIMSSFNDGAQIQKSPTPNKNEEGVKEILFVKMAY